MAGGTVRVLSGWERVHAFRIVCADQGFLECVPHEVCHLDCRTEFYKTSERALLVGASRVEQDACHIVAEVDSFPDCRRGVARRHGHLLDEKMGKGMHKGVNGITFCRYRPSL